MIIKNRYYLRLVTPVRSPSHPSGLALMILFWSRRKGPVPPRGPLAGEPGISGTHVAGLLGAMTWGLGLHHEGQWRSLRDFPPSGFHITTFRLRYMESSSDTVARGDGNKWDDFSVRCLRD